MTHEELQTRMRSAVSRYLRPIADGNGVPFGLVEELSAVAEQYAELAMKQAAAMALNATVTLPGQPAATRTRKTTTAERTGE